MTTSSGSSGDVVPPLDPAASAGADDISPSRASSGARLWSGQRWRSTRRWCGLVVLVVLIIWVALQFAAAFIASRGERFADPKDPPAIFGECWRRVTAPAVDAWWCPGTGAPIVLSHGYGGDRAGLHDLAESLHTRTGRGVLLPQLAYASGAEPFGGGEREGMAIAAAMRWAASESGSAPAVFGFSAGGYAALRAVASGAPASAVVLDSSFLSSRDVFVFGATKVLPLPQWAWAGMPLVYPLVSQGGHLGEVDRASFNDWRTPTLTLRCRTDTTVPLAYQQELAETLGAQQWVGACDEHVGAYDADSRAYVDRVVAFLAS